MSGLSLLVCLLIGRTLSDTCTPPLLSNGEVSGQGDSRAWVGVFKCNPGFRLVGNHKLKCMDGRWSSNVPSCTALGKCDAALLPHVDNAERISYNARTFRGSVYKYHCRHGFHMYGNHLVHCSGESGWDTTNIPVCSKPGCDEEEVSSLLHGLTRRMSNGGIYRFRCEPGFVMEGPSLVTCDGSRWNDSAPQCLGPGSPPSLSLSVGGEVIHSGEETHGMVIVGQELTVQCEAHGGNPPPTVQLSLHSTPLSTPSTEYNSVTLTMEPHHNGLPLTCTSINTAMEEPHTTEMVLDVRFGPRTVDIGGPSTLVQGQSEGFECVSSASNPPSELSWNVRTRDGEEVPSVLEVSQSSPSWTGHGWDTTSTALIHPGPGITSLILSCAATNSQLGIAVEESKQLILQFAPESVTVSGVDRTRIGDLLSLMCQSSPSVPAATIQWRVGGAGQALGPSQEEVEQLQDGSFVTRSHLSVRAGEGKDVEAVCYGTNSVMGNDSQAALHIVEIVSPPGIPTISGISPDSKIQNLICSTSAGHPPARLSWYRGSEMMESHYTVEGDTVSAIITFVPNQNDQEELTCEASNDALTEPIRNTITIEATHIPTANPTESSTYPLFVITTTTTTTTAETTTTTTESATESATLPLLILGNYNTETATDEILDGSENDSYYEKDMEYYDDYNFSEDHDLDVSSSHISEITENSIEHDHSNGGVTNDKVTGNDLEGIQAIENSLEEEGTIEDNAEDMEVIKAYQEAAEEHEEVTLTSGEHGNEEDAARSLEDISDKSTEIKISLESDSEESDTRDSAIAAATDTQRKTLQGSPRSEPRYSDSGRIGHNSVLGVSCILILTGLSHRRIH